jgi:hypothetical protein
MLQHRRGVIKPQPSFRADKPFDLFFDACPRCLTERPATLNISKQACNHQHKWRRRKISVFNAIQRRIS